MAAWPHGRMAVAPFGAKAGATDVAARRLGLKKVSLCNQKLLFCYESVKTIVIKRRNGGVLAAFV